MNLKRAGLAHDPRINIRNGGLAIFCPSCPQPGINVSADEIRTSITRYVILYEHYNMPIFLVIQIGILSKACRRWKLQTRTCYS